MQLFFEYSEEFNKTKGLGFLEGYSSILETSKKDFINIPHIGWNKVIQKSKKNKSKFFKKFFNGKNNFYYFVHSFHVNVKNPNIVAAKTLYGNNKFCSAIEYKNIFGTQFHPELSGTKGIDILSKFLKI